MPGHDHSWADPENLPSLTRIAFLQGPFAKVSYHAPAALAARHHLTADLAASLAGINALTDALVAS